MTAIIDGYKEYIPPVHLQLYLDCYWSYAADPATVSLNKKPIIPDGCIDIIFDLNHTATLKSFVVGAMTRPILNTKTNLIGLRFKSGMAYPFFKIPVHALTGLFVDYVEFAGQEANRFSNQLIELESREDQIFLLNNKFVKKLSNLNPVEPQMLRALSLMQSTGGKIPIKQISVEVGWSRQHFTRKCLNYTGLAPKFLNRIIRLKKILNKAEKFSSWSQLSVDMGFHDQSHMINDFKGMTGLTPIQFFSRS
ncbi:MAG: AraC family transcriptional regulator [Desulfobacteraceae bacterium]|nr:AraC family transcriptional regulator [Desulfobacteraceae bacterium]